MTHKVTNNRFTRWLTDNIRRHLAPPPPPNEISGLKELKEKIEKYMTEAQEAFDPSLKKSVVTHIYRLKSEKDIEYGDPT